jgi:hypothetical protein
MKIGEYVIYKPFPREFEKNILPGGKNLLGAEIGVFEGEHAESMLRTMNIAMLYLVDPYKDYCEVSTEQGEKFSQKLLDEAKAIAHKRLDNYPRKTFMEQTSTEFFVSMKLRGIRFDFIYIDAKHDYDSVKEDLNNAWDIVKEGGVVGGDDFFNGKGASIKAHSGTINAVIEFAYENNLQLYVHGRDWWFRKDTQPNKKQESLEDAPFRLYKSKSSNKIGYTKEDK